LEVLDFVILLRRHLLHPSFSLESFRRSYLNILEMVFFPFIKPLLVLKSVKF
jgi:hypothetical protein